MFRSLRWRLTGWYVLLLAGVLLLFSAGAYLAVRKLLRDNIDEGLKHQAELIAQAVTIENNSLALPAEVQIEERHSNDYFTRLYQRDGALVFTSFRDKRPLPETPHALADALDGDDNITQGKVGNETFRIATYPVRHGEQVVGALQVGLSTGDIEETLQTLLRVLLVLSPAILVLASGGGLFLANRALTPSDRITRTARRISAESLGGRIEHHGPDDEIGQLAQTFDAMLTRLEAAFERQRRFTSDASHELRTPLTAILGQIDVALERPREAPAYRMTLLSIREQAQRLARMTSDMLFLARADAQPAVSAATQEVLDLADLLPAVAAQVEPLAAARDQTLELAPLSAQCVRGDEDQLIRLFLNLLDNAIRYTPQGGRIAITSARDHNTIAVQISDTGPGIASEHLPQLFERFYRADRGRNRAQGGSGLGLAIAQSIAQSHGGQIAVESTPGQGSTFTVLLPATPARLVQPALAAVQEQ
jgi:heavy metal sensor kinase